MVGLALVMDYVMPAWLVILWVDRNMNQLLMRRDPPSTYYINNIAT